MRSRRETLLQARKPVASAASSCPRRAGLAARVGQLPGERRQRTGPPLPDPTLEQQREVSPLRRPTGSGNGRIAKLVRLSCGERHLLPKHVENSSMPEPLGINGQDADALRGPDPRRQRGAERARLTVSPRSSPFTAPSHQPRESEERESALTPVTAGLLNAKSCEPEGPQDLTRRL